MADFQGEYIIAPSVFRGWGAGFFGHMIGLYPLSMLGALYGSGA